MKKAMLFALTVALFLTAPALFACPIGISGISNPNADVCAESAGGTLYCTTADANGNFYIIGGGPPPSTSWGCLPTGGEFWVHDIACYNDGMNVDRDISSQQFGGSWLDVTCQPPEPNLTGFCLLGIDFRSSVSFQTTLYDVNSATGAATNPRATGVGNMIDIALRPSTDYLYGVTTFGTNVGTANALYKIHPNTGASTLIGSLGIGNIAEGDLAFHPTTEVLYGIISSKLFTINLNTGAATVVGNLSGFPADYSYLGFDQNADLYAIDNSATAGQLPTYLEELNPANGVVLSSIQITPELGGMGGMDYNQITGEFWVVDSKSIGSVYAGSDSLYKLNKTTGNLTLVGPTGILGGFSGLASCKPCAVNTAVNDHEPVDSKLTNLEVLETSYRVRDELFHATAVGAHYTKLFYSNTLRMSYLMLRDGELRSAAAELAHDAAPGFRNLVDGRGEATQLGDELVRNTESFLDHLSEADQYYEGGELAETIDVERSRINWESLSRMSFADFWDYLQTIELPREGGGR